MKGILLFSALALATLPAADFPQAEISNGLIHAKLYLPDPEHGYYQATRFDWSGVIASLEYKKHNYFGQWFEHYDPKIHDAITGPVESYGPLGYEEAKPGGTFVRIGVGALRKPDEKQINDFNTQGIVDSGKWTVRTGSEWIEFVQVIDDPSSGYGYVYRKTVRLAKDKPEMVLEHSLKNTGKRRIETDVYQHNFFVIDGQPSGPDFVVKFSFEPRATHDLTGLAALEGKQLVYLKELEKGQYIYTHLQGYGATPKDYDFRVENRKTGAGLRQVGDRPMSKNAFWSIRTTVCPEAFIDVKVEPGSEMSWQTLYEFYSLP
jgi:hypothetical protein